MPRFIYSPTEFTIVGENIHATRVLFRNGRRAFTQNDGTESIPFKGDNGEQRYLNVPEWYKSTQAYEQGQIKHFLIALMKGLSDDLAEREEGAAYIRSEVKRQVNAGAQYLDINVDEVHYDLEIQKRAMRWAIETVQQVSPIPPSVDSSNSEIIAEGLKAYKGKAGQPMVNSVALERLDALEMAVTHDTKIIVMATSGDSMPNDAEQRVENVNNIMEHVQSKGIELENVFVDAIVFPISVDSQYGNHYFEAVRTIREQYGRQLHIGMGLSNISFGMPNRKLINRAFIYLALEAGVDAGILDPIQTDIDSIFVMDKESEPITLATDMLLGRDSYCMKYIQAFRDGRLN